MFSERYILASSLQKSIRRGLTTNALKYAEILGQEDYNYLIYRLGIILTEDIGVSNTPLLNEYLDLKISKKNIEEAGGINFIFSIIEKACLSNKDRSSCDIAYFSSNITNWAIQKDEFKEVINSSPDKRLSLISDFLKLDINPALKINLIWAALGQRKYPNQILSDLNLFDYPKLKNGKNDDSIENFEFLLNSLNLNKDEIKAIINAHATQNEFMCLGMAVTYPERNKFIKKQLIDNQNYIPLIQRIDFSNDTFSEMKSLRIDIPHAAIDHHTSQGKAAYTMFMKQNSNFLSTMKNLKFSHQQAIELLPFFMFRNEGHEVNNREYFDFAKTVMTIANQVSFNHLLQLPFNDKQFSFSEISKSLKMDISQINNFRDKALNFGFEPKKIRNSFST